MRLSPFARCGQIVAALMRSRQSRLDLLAHLGQPPIGGGPVNTQRAIDALCAAGAVRIADWRCTPDGRFAQPVYALQVQPFGEPDVACPWPLLSSPQQGRGRYQLDRAKMRAPK